jgi:DNA invertase Pin-like site-specific DNA recombinase
MTGPRATPEQLDRVRQLYADDLTIAQVMRRTGLTRRQVAYALRDVHQPGQGWARKWTCDEVLAEIATLTRKLKRPPSHAELGAALGVGKQRAHAILRSLGISKPRAPGSALSVVERLKRQRIAAKKAKRRTAMVARKVTRDSRIIAMGKAKKPRAEIAERLGVHINTVGRVLRAAVVK